MGYASWLEGTLSLHPVPDAEAIAAIRGTLAAAPPSKGGRLCLTPIGHGVVVEDCVDWEAAVEAIERARETLFVVRGLTLAGCLRAVGEDGTPLGSVTIDASGMRIDRRADDDDTETWIAALRSDDPELREHAAMQLGGRDARLVTHALVNAVKAESVERVRCKALEAIGELGHGAAGALDDVVLCLSDPSPFVRYWATYALGRLGPAAARALPQLEQTTNDSADGPRYGAIDAIRRIRGR